MGHEEFLDPGQSIDRRQTKAARELHWLDVIGEQPIEPIGHRQQGDVVETPPSLVAAQHIDLTNIETQTRGLDDDLNQRRDIAIAKIEVLPGKGMQTVCRVAYQCQARGQRIGGPERHARGSSSGAPPRSPCP